jgi:hypothetical protein
MTPPRKCRHRRGRGEAGETLVETLLTVTIMSIAVVGLLFGIGTAIRLTSTHRGQANIDVALNAGAEAVKTYTPSGSPTCGTLTTSTYSGALNGAAPNGYTLSIPAAPSCLSGTSLPVVRVQATGANGQKSEITVVRRSLS